MNPGSPEAVQHGCKCPVIDNGRGKGYMGGVKDDKGETVYVINVECVVHGAFMDKEKNRESAEDALSREMMVAVDPHVMLCEIRYVEGLEKMARLLMGYECDCEEPPRPIECDCLQRARQIAAWSLGGVA